ncbi:MAG: HAMP domain-containing protein, partial [Gallionella sp.]|nr:HAMP domain-containing protein [Gallionella sp.]
MSQAESSRGEFRHITEVVMQPVVSLAAAGVDGGNQLMLANSESKALYESRKLLFLKITGSSAGAEKTSYSEAIPPRELAYEYLSEKAVADKNMADKAKAAVLSGKKDMIESDMLYVVSYPLKIKNGGEVTAVFSTEQLRSLEQKVMQEVGIRTLFVLLVALVLAIFIGRRVAGPIENISRQINEVTESMDLNARVKTSNKHEIGKIADSFNSLIANLHGLIAQIRNTSKTIGTSIEEIARGNADLSQRTEQQAANLEETASSMEELTSTVRQNAENAKQANQLASNASNIAIKGGEVVGDVVNTMSSISESSKKIV